MIEDAIRKWNPWWATSDTLQSLAGIKRDITPEISKMGGLHHIKDMIGVRRSGKTTVMYQLIKTLVKDGTSAKNITLLNFDDPEINTLPLNEVLDAVEKINPGIEYLFLDEIQQKDNWEGWVRALYDTNRIKRIFVTGSSASILSEDIGRVLTGRHLTFIVFPFSFREYLISFGWKNFDRDFLEHNKNRLNHYLESYINGGGFPEILGKNEFESKAVLTHIYNDILSRDIASRHNASFETAKKISYFLLSNAAKEFSYRKVAGALGISVETAEKYTGYLTESFMLITLDCFSFKIPVQFKQNKKAYCIDTGLKNAMSFRISEDRGRLYENAVLVELKRRGKEIYYWKDEKKREIDFLVKEGEKITDLIQVCCNLDDIKTKAREINGLTEGMSRFKLLKGVIITDNYEGKEKVGGNKIVYVPLWKWLLGL
ncbi:MAG: ATP-binding protein [Candidatus Aenigmarchaeota archaeon]|nr:ATP-binding protein [Candidatus Aenigmarchaeota archaeon]